MNPRVIILVVIALGAALGTVYMTRSWLDSQRASGGAQPAGPPVEVAKVQVLVAKEDLPAGTLLKPEQMRWQAWPDQTLAPSYIVNGKRDLTEFVGAVVRQAIATGQPITDSQIVKPGERGFLAATDMQTAVNALAVTRGVKRMIRIGFHAGPVIEEKGDVFGDTVNVASRLEGLTKNYEHKILINEPVYLAVKDKIPCVDLGFAQVKGKEGSVHIFGVTEPPE